MMNSRLRRSTLALAGLAAASALLLSGCSAPGGSGGGSGDGDAKKLKIGISQFVQAPPLDAATEGFKQAFLDAGYVEGKTVEFDLKNANAEVATAGTIAQTFAGDKPDLILAVATPSAQAAAQNITDIPVVFTAVTDPVAADLVKSTKEPGGNLTGTSDMSPVADQIELIKEIKPEAKKLGVVYSSGEVNSEVQVKLAKEAAKKQGMEFSEQTVTNANELKQATEALGDVDAIWTPSDNLVIAGLGSIIGVAEERGILVVGSDAEHVKGGAAATLGLDYTKLGYQTGEMALRILKDGADPATMPVETSTELALTVNPEAAVRLGAKLPQAVIDRAADVVN